MNDTNMTSLSLETTETFEGESSIRVSVATEFMEDYAAGLPIGPQNAIRVVQDSKGEPMVFSIGTEGAFYLIQRDPLEKTGWRQTNLSDGIEKDLTAQAFEVVQSQDGTLRVALGVEVKGSATQSELYLLEGISNDLSATDWSAISKQWIECPQDLGAFVVTSILLGTDGGASGGALTVAAIEKNGEAFHYLIDPAGKTPDEVWIPFPFPQNVDEILDLAVGALGDTATMRGVWGLYTVGGKKVLMFTSFPEANFATTFNFNFKDFGTEATRITVLPGKDGNYSNLFVAGSGVQVFRFMTGSDPINTKPTSVVSAEAVADARGMIACADGDTVSLWVADRQESLLYTQGDLATLSHWTPPVALFDGAVQIAPMRSLNRKANEIFVVTAESDLKYFWQDPSTSLWSNANIPVYSTKHVQSYSCYTTRLRFTDAKGNTFAGKTFQLAASAWCFATVNGAFFDLDTEPVDVETDVTGSLTIIQRLSDLSAPALSLRAGFLKTGLDLHASATVRDQLASMGESEIAAATYRYGSKKGEKVLQGRYAKPDWIRAASSALGQLTKIQSVSQVAGSATPAAAKAHGVYLQAVGTALSNRVDTSQLPKGFAWGVSLDRETARYNEGDSAANIIADILLGPIAPIEWLIGDLVKNFEQELDAEPKGFFMHLTAEGVLEFIFDFGKAVVRTAIDVLEQVDRAILDPIFKYLFGITFDDVLDWLGFIFDWPDILQTHKAIVNLTNQGFDFIDASLEGIEEKVETFFDNLKSQLHELAGLPDAIKGINVKQVADAQDSSGQRGFLTTSHQGNWGTYQLEHGGVLDGTAPGVPMAGGLVELLDSFVSDVVDPAWKDIEKASTKLTEDVFAAFTDASLTPADVLVKLTDDVLDGLLDVIKDIAVGLLKVAEDLLLFAKDNLNEEIEIPLLTGLYEKWIAPGSPFTLLDAFALLIAVPTTTVYKAIYDRAPVEAGSPLITSRYEEIFGTKGPSKSASAPAGAERLPSQGASGTLAAADSPPARTPLVDYSYIGAGFIYSMTGFIYEIGGPLLAVGQSKGWSSKRMGVLQGALIALSATRVGVSLPIGGLPAEWAYWTTTSAMLATDLAGLKFPTVSMPLKVCGGIICFICSPVIAVQEYDADVPSKHFGPKVAQNVLGAIEILSEPFYLESLPDTALGLASGVAANIINVVRAEDAEEERRQHTVM